MKRDSDVYLRMVCLYLKLKLHATSRFTISCKVKVPIGICCVQLHFYVFSVLYVCKSITIFGNAQTFWKKKAKQTYRPSICHHLEGVAAPLFRAVPWAVLCRVAVPATLCHSDLCAPPQRQPAAMGHTPHGRWACGRRPPGVCPPAVGRKHNSPIAMPQGRARPAPAPFSRQHWRANHQPLPPKGAAARGPTCLDGQATCGSAWPEWHRHAQI